MILHIHLLYWVPGAGEEVVVEDELLAVGPDAVAAGELCPRAEVPLVLQGRPDVGGERDLGRRAQPDQRVAAELLPADEALVLHRHRTEKVLGIYILTYLFVREGIN